MSTLTIRDFDDALKRLLRLRAASRNRSMEEEVRQILRTALLAPQLPKGNLATRIRARFDGLGNVELPTPAREAIRPPPAFNSAVPARRKAAGRRLRSP